MDAIETEINQKKKKDLLKTKAITLFENRKKLINDFNPFLSEHQIKELLHYLDAYFQVQFLYNKLQRVIIKIENYEKIQNDGEKEIALQDIGNALNENQCAVVKLEPSWQMFELENNLFIRKQQADLAVKMHRAVNESNNTLYQLNMGEGKSSVVIIILSELLTSDEKLVRINVIEPLLATTKTLLSEKFGQLLEKRIYLMPFSRHVDVSIKNLEKIKTELLFCKKNKHIMLMTPEHRLSFQLKWEEILLDYLDVKSADDRFDWENFCPNFYIQRYYSNRDSFNEMAADLKETLVKLGYIDQTNKIRKYPEKFGRMSFEDEVLKQNKNIRPYLIYYAFIELRSKSVAIKLDIEKKLNLFLEIDKIDSVDVLDESDEILRYGVELNYTLGVKGLLDGGEIRWKVAEKIFEVIYFDSDIKKSIKEASERGLAVYIESTGNGVPQIQILDQRYYGDLKKLILDSLLKIVAEIK